MVLQQQVGAWSEPSLTIELSGFGFVPPQANANTVSASKIRMRKVVTRPLDRAPRRGEHADDCAEPDRACDDHGQAHHDWSDHAAFALRIPQRKYEDQRG